jgi:hypothetical protein
MLLLITYTQLLITYTQDLRYWQENHVLGQKGGVPEWESHSYDLFFRPRRVSWSRLVRTTSFCLAREDHLRSSSEKPSEEFPPRTRRPAEEFL